MELLLAVLGSNAIVGVLTWILTRKKTKAEVGLTEANTGLSEANESKILLESMALVSKQKDEFNDIRMGYIQSEVQDLKKKLDEVLMKLDSVQRELQTIKDKGV